MDWLIHQETKYYMKRERKDTLERTRECLISLQSSCLSTRSLTSYLHTIILSLVFLIWSFTFPSNPTSQHFTFRPFNRMFHDTFFCKRCSTNWLGVESHLIVFDTSVPGSFSIKLIIDAALSSTLSFLAWAWCFSTQIISSPWVNLMKHAQIIFQPTIKMKEITKCCKEIMPAFRTIKIFK